MKAPRKFFRLAPGREVRLRYAYLVTCTEVVEDQKGNIIEIHCDYDPDSAGGNAPDGRKVKGTLHWVSARHAVDAEIRLYDRLFLEPNPRADPATDFMDLINPESLVSLPGAKVESGLAEACRGDTFQFERTGYFCTDPDSTPGSPVFNRTVPLRDSWGRNNS